MSKLVGEKMYICPCGKECDGRYKISKIPHCRKCYYEQLGEIVEKHPIGMPISHEMTKIVNIKCQDCEESMRILTNASSTIIAAQCPTCTKEWVKKNIPDEQR